MATDEELTAVNHDESCPCYTDGVALCPRDCPNCTCVTNARGELSAFAGTVRKVKSDGSSSDYYKLPPGAEQIQDLVEFKNMNFSMGNIFKAAYRMGQKAGNDDLYDIRKIIWYANRELERLTKLQQETK